MAVSLGATINTSIDFVAGSGLSYTPDSGSNRIVLLLFGARSTSSRTISSTTHNSVAATATGRNQSLGTNYTYAATARWIESAVQASGSFANTWSGAMTDAGRGGAITLIGVDQTTPVVEEDIDGTTTTDTITSAGVAVAAGDLIISTVACNTTSTVTSAPSGYSVLWNVTGTGSATVKYVAYYKTISGAGTETPSYTFNGNNTSAAMRNIVVKAAAGSSVAPLAAAYYYNR
jgi:hypothetical protein